MQSPGWGARAFPHILPAAALHPAAHSAPRQSRLASGQRQRNEPMAADGMPSSPRLSDLCSPGKQIWVQTLMPAPASCGDCGKLSFPVCKMGVTVGLNEIACIECTVQSGCFLKACRYFYNYFYDDEQYPISSSLILSLYSPRTLRELEPT